MYLFGHTRKKMESRSRPNPRRLKAKLILAGHTFESFAVEHGFKRDTVKAAIHGKRRGPVSQAITQKIGGLSHAA